eukprot:7099389-Ditylum_brightwellii.AAC.1
MEVSKLGWSSLGGGQHAELDSKDHCNAISSSWGNVLIKGLLLVGCVHMHRSSSIGCTSFGF